MTPRSGWPGRSTRQGPIVTVRHDPPTGRTGDADVAHHAGLPAVKQSNGDGHLRHDGPGHVGLVDDQVGDLVVGGACEQRFEVTAKVLASAHPLRPTGRGEGELELDVLAAQVEVTGEVAADEVLQARSEQVCGLRHSIPPIRTNGPADNYTDCESV